MSDLKTMPKIKDTSHQGKEKKTGLSECKSWKYKYLHREGE